MTDQVVSGGELFLEWSYPSSLVVVASVAVVVLVVVVVVVPARVVATGAGAAAVSATQSETSRIVVVFHTPVIDYLLKTRRIRLSNVSRLLKSARSGEEK